MSRPKSVEKKLREGFERLKANTPKNMPNGTKVTMSNVAKEAIVTPNAFRKERYPELHREVSAWIEIAVSASPNRNGSQKIKRESDRKTIKKLKRRNQKLLSQLNSQIHIIETLEAELDMLKQSKVTELQKNKD